MSQPKQNKNGVWCITITFSYSRRKLTLGLIDRKEAIYFASNINQLISHRKQHSGIPLPLRSWVDSLSSAHKKQLGELGVLSESETIKTVQQLIEKFLSWYDRRPISEISVDTKKSMKMALTHRFPPFLKKRCFADLEPVLPDDRPHAKPTFSPDAEDFFAKVVSWQREHYALSSWSRANGRLREVGNWAVHRGICKFNPFSLLPKPEQVNDKRNQNIDRQWVLDVMENCLDPDTRLAFALARFAGMRTPSECRRMKPDHIDEQEGSLRIIGKGNRRPERVMPLFEIVKSELDRHKLATGGWGRFIFSDRFLQSSDSNNFNLMRESVIRAGYEPWPRLRQNLRSSCENDLMEAGFAERLVVSWIGHTVRTSRQAYQKQTIQSRKQSITDAKSIGF